MESGVGVTVVSGLGLGGVLAIAAAWSLRAGQGGLPHPALGALAGVAALAGFRLSGLPRPVVLVLVAVGCAVLGAGIAIIERRFPVHPPWLAQVATLAVLLGVAGLLQPAGAVSLPFGPLGARAAPAPSLIALLAGSSAALLVGGLRVRRAPAPAGLLWAGAGAALATATLVAAGAMGAEATRALGLIALPDTVGLAIRAFAVALLAKDGPTAVVVGLGAGVGESLIAARDPFEGFLLAPALVLGVTGLALRLRHAARVRGVR